MLNWFTKKGDGQSPSLRKDDDGAIMVIGVFMAVFLVGMLYYLMGLGQTMLFRQRMQDAADATAFSGAVMNARGMNLMVLINLIMALLLAILIIIRALQILLGVALVIVTVLCAIPWTAAVGCPLVSPIGNLLNQVTQLYNRLENPIFKACEALTKVNRVIRAVWWLVAQADAITTAMIGYNPPIMVGFVWPVYQQMPTQDGQFAKLCERAAEIPGQIFGNLIGGAVGRFIAGMLNGFFRLAAATICGFPSSGTPSLGSFEGENLDDAFNSKALPQGPYGAACEGPPANSDACQQYSTWMTDSTPSGTTCATAPNPSLCESRMSEAGSACNPSNSNNPRDHSFFIETAIYQYEVGNMGELIRPTMPVNPPTTAQGRDLPCGTGSGVERFSAYSGGQCAQDHNAIGQDWYDRLDVDTSLDPQRRPRQTRQFTVQRVVGVLSCKVNRDRSIDGGSQPSQAANAGACGNPDIAPQEMKECARNPGEKVFQVLSMVMSSDGTFNRFRTGNDRGIFVAGMGRRWSQSGIGNVLQELGRFSFAQGEFFWEAPNPRFYGNHDLSWEEWMWEMGWRGRMRRLDAPDKLFAGSGCQNAGSCSGGGGGNPSVTPSSGQANQGDRNQGSGGLNSLGALLIH